MVPFGRIIDVDDSPVGGRCGDRRNALISAPESRMAVLAVQAGCVVVAGIVLSGVRRLIVL